MGNERLSLVDALGSFAPGQPLRAALVLTYCFDGRWFEEAVAPELFERPVATTLLLRDRNALISEAPSVRYHRADAAYSTRVFHPKLALFVAEDRARAIIGSANMTRGGFERNLELGSVFDLHPDGGSRSFFKALHAYMIGPLRRETDGNGLLALQDATVALWEVIEQAPVERESSPHVLLHNYDTPLWEQLLANLPHRNLRRAIIVSPFFEPDTASESIEDPPGQASDESVFNRLFSDFQFETEPGEEPVSVYFHEDNFVTSLPVVKLNAWKNRLNLFQRLPASDDARRLHGKLLVLEGTGKKGHQPFLFALHGSPNFSAAALLTTPPEGNAELAVLTRLPHRGGGANKVATALGLDTLFGPVQDWTVLHTKPTTSPPRRDLGCFAVTDATLQVAGKIVVLSVRNPPAEGVKFRLMAEVEGTWVLVSEGGWENGDTLKVLASILVTEDPRTKLHTLISSRVRLEILSPDGNVLAKDEIPLNVDCPQHFCGLAMVGPLLLTLDQRIAQAGAGSPMTYREQQKWLERFRQQDASAVVTVSTHQADLDKFFRNLYTGLSGLRRRLDKSPGSEFTLRNTLRQLSGWCTEAVAQEAKIATDECRIFLLDRLAREMLTALNGAAEIPAVSSRLPTIANEVLLLPAIEAAQSWLAAFGTVETAAYLRRTQKQFTEITKTLGRLGRQQ